MKYRNTRFWVSICLLVSIYLLFSSFTSFFSFFHATILSPAVAKIYHNTCNWHVYRYNDENIEVLSSQVDIKETAHVPPPSKIALLLVFDGSFVDATLTQMSIDNKKKYCEKHGYQLVIKDAPLDESKPTAWSKFPAVLEALFSFDLVVCIVLCFIPCA